MKARGKTASTDFVLMRRRLTDEEWDEMLRNSPSSREERQVMSYSSRILEEYRDTAREDLSPPPVNVRGLILIDGIKSPSKTRQVLSSFILSVYKKIRQDFSDISGKTNDDMVRFPRSLFQLGSPSNDTKRLAIMTLPFEAPTNVQLDDLFPLPVPLSDLHRSHPFEHVIADQNHVVLYLSVATHGSPGDSAAFIARNHHGLEYARELAHRYGCKKIAWLDLAGEYNNETHRPLILRLCYQSEEVNGFYEEIEFIDYSCETDAILFQGEPVPSVEALRQKLGLYDMVMVSGIEAVRSLVQPNLRGIADTLVTHIMAALSSTARCTLWFDSPAPLATTSELYKHHQFQPLQHDSPLLAHIDEIVLNLPYPPRLGGSEVPRYDYVRGMVQVPQDQEKETSVRTVPVLPLVGWSRRFKSLDLNKQEQSIARRLLRRPKTGLWLRRIGIEEFSRQMAVELFPFLQRHLSIEDSDTIRRERSEVSITRTELTESQRSKEYLGVMSRVTFDDRLCDKDSLEQIETKRKYWTPKLEVKPMMTVPLPPPESDLVFDGFQRNTTEAIEVQRLQDVRRVLLERIPEYSPFHRFFGEFVEIFARAAQSEHQQDLTQAVIDFLRSHHYTKDLWYRSAWFRNNLDNWAIPLDMRTELTQLQAEDDDLLLRYGNYFIILLAQLAESHSYTQTELKDLWNDIRPWLSMQLGAMKAKTSLPEPAFDMDALYSHLSARTRSFRESIRSATVPLTNVRYGISVSFDKKNLGAYDWFIFESAPYDNGVIAGCIRLDKRSTGRYLSANAVTALDELGDLAGYALSDGTVTPIVIADYAGLDILYQGMGGGPTASGIGYGDLRWELRGAVRFGTRYRGAPARLRYLKVMSLGMTYPQLRHEQKLPERGLSLAERLFNHLGTIQEQVSGVERAKCTVGGSPERG